MQTKTIFFRVLIIICGLGFIGLGMYLYYRETFRFPLAIVSPVGKSENRMLDMYAIEELQKRAMPSDGKITFDTAIATESSYTTWTFHFMTGGKKRVSGIANVPSSIPKTGQLPVIVQFRGYVDRDAYTPGEGTRKSGIVFAKNGFLTLAPDFLGYGSSDMPSEHIFEERFETYTTALDLLSSIPSIPYADTNHIGLWGHSNGGHIALVILEVMQARIPTSLWAPVTKPFPYSILYYTDELSDGGKYLRQELSKFEQVYDVDAYSPVSYLQDIYAPIQIHQGTTDDAVPLAWSDAFVTNMKKLGKDINYYTYVNADHNMASPPPLAWDTVVKRDIEFFTLYLK